MAKIAKVTFTSADRVRDVIHNFNADRFDSRYPKYKAGRPSHEGLRILMDEFGPHRPTSPTSPR